MPETMNFVRPSVRVQFSLISSVSIKISCPDAEREKQMNISPTRGRVVNSDFEKKVNVKVVWIARSDLPHPSEFEVSSWAGKVSRFSLGLPVTRKVHFA